MRKTPIWSFDAEHALRPARDRSESGVNPKVKAGVVPMTRRGQSDLERRQDA